MAGNGPQQFDGIWVPPGTRVPSTSPEPPTAAAAEAGVDLEPVEPAADDPVEVELAAVAAEPDWHDRYLRALAEADNQRKRATEQQRVAVQRANERFIMELLPVLDSASRGLQAATEDATVESMARGLDLVARQLGNFLNGNGVEEIPAAVGEPFDPELHEAMLRQPATAELADGAIAAVLEKGFRLHGRVIRPARVAVAYEPLDESA
ncbi:MAG: nucleotide exchange factor GrpE [Fimbriimonadaceae bacterium]|nr:nucleotide exchange factor GrpE [Fimbriimonadaceae bacterium]